MRKMEEEPAIGKTGYSKGITEGDIGEPEIDMRAVKFASK
jgi:hypothetical protein